MSQPDYQGLSNQFRLYGQSLSPSVRERFIQATQLIFGIRDRSNVVRWITDAGIQRNFINRSVAPFELKLRIAYAEALTIGSAPTSPLKEQDFGTDTTQIAKKMTQYLTDRYLRNAVTSIAFLDEETLYFYESDSTLIEEFDDDASDEFDDIVTETEAPPSPPPPQP